eukprot:Clim_evm27s155 gene=Clim_evmTU27s155
MSAAEIIQRAKSQCASAEVNREVEPDYDVGNLSVFDTAGPDLSVFQGSSVGKKARAVIDEHLRENAQLLVNQIWELPTEHVDRVVVAQLPGGSTKFPRKLPLPPPKTLTKWEEFAKKRGITKRKRSVKVFDENAGEWRARHGRNRVGKETENPWLTVLPDQADPFADHLGQKAQEKKARVAKNKSQQQRNLEKRAKLAGLPMDDIKVTNKDKFEKKQYLKNNILRTRASTASLGRFQENLRNEVKQKGKKRKFDPVVFKEGEEKNRDTRILDSILNRKTKSVLNTTVATNQHIAGQERKRAAAKRAAANGDEKGARKKRQGPVARAKAAEGKHRKK